MYRDFGTITAIHNGLRAKFRVNNKTTTKIFRGRDARAKAKKWLADQHARLHAQPGPNPGFMGFKAYAASVSPRIQIRVKPNTWRSYEHHIKVAVDHFGDKPIRTIGYEEADAFLCRVARTVKPATVHRYRATLSKVFKYAVRERYAGTNPFRGLDLERPAQPVREYLDRKQVEDRLAKLSGELLLFARIAYETGLRLSENAALLVQDFPGDGRPRVIVRESKSGRGRVVPLTPEAQAVLPSILSRPRSVRDADRAWRYSASYYCRAYSTAMKVAGFGDTLHALRHACASRLAGQMPLHLVQRWMGHESIVTTRKYVHAARDALFDALGAAQDDLASTPRASTIS